MISDSTATLIAAETHLPGEELEAHRMPGHWLLARLGKRVLRPGGAELTSRLLKAIDIGKDDDVVEIAPGLGSTTRRILAISPASYTGVDRDAASAELISAIAEGPNRRVVQASAADTGLDDASADVIFGEAYLTMQPDSLKHKIIAELARVLRPGGRLALHEIAFAPDDIDDDKAKAVAGDLRSTIKVNVTPMTVSGWEELLGEYGFEVTARTNAPLHLLEPRRLIADEGFAGALRFAKNLLGDSDARARVLGMRRAMRANATNLQAYGLVATKKTGSSAR